MKNLTRLTRTLLSSYYAYMLEYRAELFLWALSGSLPFILMGIWMKASQSEALPLTRIQFAQYFLAAFIVRQANVVWVIWEFEKDVVQGRLSPKLLQPMDPVWHHVAAHISERFARLPFILGIILLFFGLYPEAFWLPSLGTFLLFIGLLVLAFGLRFLMQYTFGLLAFWTERAAAIEDIWFLPYLFLSGIVAPLEVFPPGIRHVISWTPFPYLIHFPASLLIGLPIDLGRGLLVMGIWGVIFLGLNRLLWRQGLKRYSGMGA
ncbi:MAG: multidrug ABC transporter permease [Oscillatoriales cyanobacterium RM1_1_9]|nr:multidrug ABC transporter permease [Oscillatoriales cyanobacterium SM2_3_0]NJO46574.1 multidrug ABC transporter permease [Oscillatoriales cyanobacterium RM2_1_1]NJO71117.1 multidrug ABC transporter permease [Oscillatoriales cyanobacterium RM1_1_9]